MERYLLYSSERNINVTSLSLNMTITRYYQTFLEQAVRPNFAKMKYSLRKDYDLNPTTSESLKKVHNRENRDQETGFRPSI